MYLKTLTFELFNQQFCIDFENALIIEEIPKISVLIGPNGTGKSHILGKIVDIFRDINSFLENKPISKNNFELIYKQNNHDVSVKNTKGQLSFWINGNQVEVLDKTLHLPSNILAVSYLLNDRFVHSQENTGFYLYLGIRTAANASYIGAFVKRTFANLFHYLIHEQNNRIAEGLKHITNFLGYSSIRSVYSIKLKTLQSSGFTVKTFEERRKALLKKDKHIVEKVFRLTKDEMKDAVQFLKNHQALDSNSEVALIIDMDIEAFNLTSNDVACLEVLSTLGFIEPPIMEAKRNGTSEFSGNFSTGEANILFNAINILTHVKNDSLILIDEPEISLHPNWQMQYIDLLRSIIKATNVHVFIATHSHFLISDLNSHESTLHAMRMTVLENKVKREVEKIQYSTYAWSPESILYRVFNARAYNSFVIKQDIAYLLKYLSALDKSEFDSEYVQSKINDLMAIVDFNDLEDPLVQLLRQIQTLVG